MPFERILVAIDGSQVANRALATARDLSRPAGAHLTALTIAGPLVEVRAGHAAELITECAREHAADRVAHHAHCPVMIVK